MVALSWLLRHRSLALELRAGDSEGIDIDWAHALEIEDPTPWLAGSELVLTTGVRLRRTRAAQTAYVERLADAGIAALGFGVGLSYDEIPAAVVAACERTGLPLIEVPLPTPFIAIVRTVADRIASDREAQVHHLVSVQRAMTRGTQRQGVAGMVPPLATELGADVAVLDEHGVAIGSRGFGSAELSALMPVLADAGANDVPTVPDVEVLALSGRSGRRGWLLVRGLARVTPTQRLLTNHAAAIASVALDAPRALDESRSELLEAAFSVLLAAPETAATLLPRFGLGNDAPLTVWALHPTTKTVRERVAGRLDAGGLPHLRQTCGRDLLVVVRADDRAPMLDQIREALPQTDVGLGSSPAGGAADLSVLVSAARRAAATARGRGDRIARYADLSVQSLLSDPQVTGRLRDVADPLLAPIRDRPALVEALTAYLLANGSWEATARELGVHRHTARARVASASEALGVDLDQAHTRAALLLALGS